ncbi:MAG: hypothetical protein JWN87_2340, partial [Frankiales bacterium]|nr:hypothetical protein [Frankiales bacterium]
MTQRSRHLLPLIALTAALVTACGTTVPLADQRAPAVDGLGGPSAGLGVGAGGVGADGSASGVPGAGAS